VDILGIRARRSREEVGGTVLQVDEDFIEELGGVNTDIAIMAEIGIGPRSMSELFPREKMRYCSKIFGQTRNVQRVYFDMSKKGEEFEKKNGVLIVPPNRCRELILLRFSQMETEDVKEKLETSKIGSWNWSEEFLADLLFLKKQGFLRDQ